MRKQPSDTQQQRLNASIKRLTQAVDRCADTIRKLTAVVECDLPAPELETETVQSSQGQPTILDDQPIILTDDDGTVTIVVDSDYPFPRILK